MKYAPILVPLSLALASAGGVMYYASMQPVMSEAPLKDPHVRHPVTAEMLSATGAMAAKPAPFFQSEDLHGKGVQIGGAGKKPQFIYFILKGCPCSTDAQPLFNRMYDRFRGKVDFIGVINVDRAGGKDYAGEHNVLSPIVPDEPLKIIKAFGAKQSVYSAIVKPDGSILKMYPGYSLSMLKDLNKRLAELSKTKEEPFDAAYAPKEYASGCYF